MSDGFSFDFGLDSKSADDSPFDRDAERAPTIITDVTFSDLLEASHSIPSDRELTMAIEGRTLRYQVSPKLVELTGDKDIVPGKYLGGLKVWSCAIDLCRYLLSQTTRMAATDEVLEVGCGQALPSIAAMYHGARRLTLHDFNAEVLDSCTTSNIVRNLSILHSEGAVSSSGRCSFVHGDWDDFWPVRRFQYILGSDVTYDEEACAKLARILRRCLATDGVALIATKKYYFGTGGGVEEFLRVLDVCGLCSETVWSSDSTNELDRVILRVSLRR